MTKQEVKDEHKQTEGDPMIKSRLRGLRLARAAAADDRGHPKADVIVTNPTHYAWPLKYDAETMSAPVLIAKGQDLVALRIRQLPRSITFPSSKIRRSAGLFMPVSTWTERFHRIITKRWLR